MDGPQFDALAKALSQSFPTLRSRRQALGAALGALLAVAEPDWLVSAKRRKKKKKRRH